MMAEAKSRVDEVFEKLAEPFGYADIEWRVGRSGEKGGKPWAILLPYVDGRAIQRRLDEVVGPAYWQDEYRQVNGNAKESGFVCRLTVEVDGKTIIKEGVAPFTDIEGLKGAESGALKRAAVKFGIGRHLYGEGEHFAQNIQPATNGKPRDSKTVSIVTGKGNDKKYWWCLAPSLDGSNYNPHDREVLIERLAFRIGNGKPDAVKYLQDTLNTIGQRDGKPYTYLSDLPLNRLQQWTENLNKAVDENTVTDADLDKIMNSKPQPVRSR